MAEVAAAIEDVVTDARADGVGVVIFSGTLFLRFGVEFYANVD